MTKFTPLSASRVIDEFQELTGEEFNRNVCNSLKGALSGVSKISINLLFLLAAFILRLI